MHFPNNLLAQVKIGMLVIVILPGAVLLKDILLLAGQIQVR